MTGLDYFAFFVVALVASMAIGAFVFLGGWPGQVAKKNDHPYVDAITIGGWITLIAGGVAWPFVLIWAYAPPGGTRPLSSKQDEADDSTADSSTSEKGN